MPRFAAVLVLATLAACNRDAPKPALDAPKKTTELGDDAPGFNDFLPSSGTTTLAVKVDGGVLEAGTSAVVAEGAPGKLHVVEAGVEPRAPRKYAFVANRSERRTLTIRQTISQEGQTQDQPALAMTVDFVPKDVKPTATRFEMKVVKVELAEKDKVDPRMAQQAAQQLGVFNGLVAEFEVSPKGEIGEITMKGDPKMQREGAAEMLEAFQQFVELVLAPLPEAPIGIGARWESEETQENMGIKATSKRVLELKDASNDGATIVSSIEKVVPKRTIAERPGQPTMSLALEAKGTYTYATRWNGIVTKVTGEQTTHITRELSNPDNPKQTRKIEQEAKVTHVLEAPAGGGGGAPAR